MCSGQERYGAPIHSVYCTLVQEPRTGNSSQFRVSGSGFVFRVHVRGSRFEVRSSRFRVPERRGDREQRTPNPELRTLTLNPEHEPGTWNLELGTWQLGPRRVAVIRLRRRRVRENMVGLEAVLVASNTRGAFFLFGDLLA